MGACVSIHRDSESAVKAQLSFGSKPDKLAIPSLSLRDFGSKEETFFDSQAWLDSDCEDDFVSVRGEFTPSRGSTPVHHNFSVGTPRVNGALSSDQTPISFPEPSPTASEKRMRLSDLFNDGLRSRQDDPLEPNGKTKEQKSDVQTPGANSVSSSEKTPNGSIKAMRGRSSAQCCLPGLRKSYSFSEKKRKTKMSPALGDW